MSGKGNGRVMRSYARPDMRRPPLQWDGVNEPQAENRRERRAAKSVARRIAKRAARS